MAKHAKKVYFMGKFHKKHILKFFVVNIVVKVIVSKKIQKPDLKKQLTEFVVNFMVSHSKWLQLISR